MVGLNTEKVDQPTRVQWCMWLNL